MLVSQDFETDLPPKMFMLQVLDSVAKAYCFLWERRDSENSVDMTWKDVSRHYNKNNFRSTVRKLNSHGVLTYDESLNGIHIELVTVDEVLGCD